MQNPNRLHAGGGESNNSHALLNASAVKTRQAMVTNQQQQHVQKQQSNHYVVLEVRPGGNNIHPSNKSVIITRSSSPQRATPEGIAIGTLSTAVFRCNNDPMVRTVTAIVSVKPMTGCIILTFAECSTLFRSHQSMGHSSAP